MFSLENEEEEEIFAEQEEKEAMALQQRMLSHLDQEDFDFFEAEVPLFLLCVFFGFSRNVTTIEMFIEKSKGNC